MGYTMALHRESNLTEVFRTEVFKLETLTDAGAQFAADSFIVRTRRWVRNIRSYVYVSGDRVLLEFCCV